MKNGSESKNRKKIMIYSLGDKHRFEHMKQGNNYGI